MAVAWRRVAGALELFVRLTPGASRDALGGSQPGPDRLCLAARVRAVPEDGKANAALLQLLARELDLPVSVLSLASGHRARLKTVRIEGVGPAHEQRLADLLERQRT